MTSSQDPDRTRQEIERTQTHLGRDVDALTEKVTPGRVVERRVNRVRNTASRWRDTVMGTAPGRAAQRLGSPGEVKDEIRDRAGSVQHRAGEAVSNAASTASGAAQQAASTAGSVLQQAPQVARQQAQGNPLAAGLIAFGIGWLVSSILPATAREQRLAEQAYDTGREKAQELAPVAQQVSGEVRDNLREPAQQAVESVKSTATEGGQAVAQEAKAAGEQVRDRTQDAASTVREQATH
jgi:uncharacterized protein YjbJ (UPF0337 family)